MPKLKFFLVLLLACNIWAVPYSMEVVKEGSGDTIRAGQLIKVHYKGFLLADLLDTAKAAVKDSAAKDSAKVAPAATADSAAVDSAAATGPQPFANSYDSGEPLEFTIGMGQVIPGWEKGLMGMKVARSASLPCLTKWPMARIPSKAFRHTPTCILKWSWSTPTNPLNPINSRRV